MSQTRPLRVCGRKVSRAYMDTLAIMYGLLMHSLYVLGTLYHCVGFTLDPIGPTPYPVH